MIKKKHQEEMTSLIQRIQEHSKTQMEKKNKEMKRIKESIKLLYLVIRTIRPTNTDKSTRHNSKVGGAAAMQEVTTDHTQDDNDDDENDRIRMLLKTMILAMSTTKRRAHAQKTIEQLSEAFHKARIFSSSKSPSNKMIMQKNSSMGSIHEEDTTFISTIKPTASKGIDFCCQVTNEDFILPKCMHFQGGFEDGTSIPECMDEYRIDGIPLLSSGRKVQKEDQTKNKLPLFNLNDGIRLSDEVVEEMRHVLPELPESTYYLTPKLRQKLLMEMISFYSHLEEDLSTANDTKFVEEKPDLHQQIKQDQETYLTFVGSPRQMVFMRRKAQETFTKSKLQSRQQIFVGGASSKGVTSVKSLPK
jgi:hypothetical protein